jgi:gamma-glutamyltranspeptidase/glutathione hydrolase
MLIEVVALAAVLQGDSVTLASGVRSPAYSPDGRLAVSLRGDLWVIDRPGEGTVQARRVTEGSAWDRDPAWAADGQAIVFSSDRAGGLDLWRVGIGKPGADEAAKRPQPLTTGGHEDGKPTVSARGEIVFVRGSGANADLWLIGGDGAPRRLTNEPGAELEPAFAPDGSTLAYVAVRNGVRMLRIRTLEGDDHAIRTDRPAERPAWSPDGQRLVFTTGGRAPGVWVTTRDGRYVSPVSTKYAAAAWSPDGEWIAVADEPSPDAGYNGDPDRLGDRAAGDIFRAGGGLTLVPPPRALEAGAVSVMLEARLPREAYNADAFDRVWERVARLYGRQRSSGTTDEWRLLNERYRARALATDTDAELEAAIHAMLRDRPAARPAATGRAAVSSAHPLATAAGLEVLEAGGNVVDAAVAVSFALGVVEPDASGIGGYGELLVHLDGMTEPAAIEFMTRVPEAATLSNTELAQLPQDGPKLANVPGTVAGMELAWRRYGSGKLPWQRLLEPAIRLAERGYPIDEGFATTLRREREAFARYPSSIALFFRDGQPLGAGDTLRNPDLAWTLRQIATGGAREFYEGEPARRLVSDLRAGGSPITAEDMSRYFAAERTPVRGNYRGHAVYSGPPPVTGGASLVAKLNLLELAGRGGEMIGDPAKLHAMIEAWKLQPSTANRIADPDLWPVDVTPFESKDTARMRWRCFEPSTSSVVGTAASCPQASEAIDTPRPEQQAGRQSGTTAFAVIDANGNAVSVTQTLGTWGGNFYVSPGLGFLYNDKLGSYRSDPSAYNARLPYARNTTVIAPTIVFDRGGPKQRPLLAVGAAGNAWITAAVYQIVVGVVDHVLDVQRAIELPRFLVGGGGRADGRSVIQIEDGFDPAAIRQLESMGHAFERISLKGELRMGYAAAVMVLPNGDAVAGADPRRAGAAGAIR